ncbi:DNA-processing protein DprA [Candidatus Saccharibacteria bacterium]|nr:DNA-processing protein DprA [Candidatus Saccharibacteria bacterium]
MSTLFSHFFQKINQITPLESDFTEVLDTIAVKPKMLYFYGKMPENVVLDGFDRRPKCVAIVGSRRCTKYGEEVAYRLAYELARMGVVVISGLAYGIDAAAHRGAVAAGGVTVAVLGTPINRVYPRGNLRLAEEILAKGGCIMSEYGVGAQVLHKVSFLERNRLISGLADVVVVAEAAVKSGALNTATHALEQGRDLLAVPGDITRPMSVGCNRLIRQGAMPYTCLDDVMSLLFPSAQKRQKRLLMGDTELETAILRAIDGGVRDGEEMVRALGVSVTEFNQAVTMLEIKGQIRALGMNQWSLN